MGRKSRERRLAVINGEVAAHGSKKESALSIVKQAVFGKISDTHDAMVQDVRNHIGQELFKQCVKLVRDDIKRGKVKDIEQYVATSMESCITPKVMKVLQNGNVAPEEIEALIRQTLKDGNIGRQ